MDSGLRRNDELVEKWDGIRTIRRSVSISIEPLRREKEIGSSLEADVTLALGIDGEFGWDGVNLFVRSSKNEPIFISTSELAEACIVAAMSIVDGSTAITVRPTTNHKCGRCWRHLPEVSEDGALCDRCDTVLNG